MARKLVVSLEAFTLLLCSGEWALQIAQALLDFVHSYYGEWGQNGVVPHLPSHGVSSI